MLKSLGYFISTLSVLLLGIVSWKATETDMTLRLCLIAGLTSSVFGMFLRWLSFRRDERPTNATHHRRPSVDAPAGARRA